jgi:diguanylate cyclase (GGDEF)-like protein/PAS domain S-box-containing protein
MTANNDSLDQKKSVRMTFDDWDLFEPSPDGIFLLDPEQLRIVKTNSTFLKMLGMEPEDLPPGSPLSRFATTPASITETNIKRLFGIPERSGNFSTRYRKKDGSIFHARLRATLAGDHGNAILFVRVIDVTGEAEAEKINHVCSMIDQQILLKNPLQEVLRSAIHELATFFSFPAVTCVFPTAEKTVGEIEVAGIDKKLISAILEPASPIHTGFPIAKPAMLDRTFQPLTDLFLNRENLSRDGSATWCIDHGVEEVLSIPISGVDGEAPYAILSFFSKIPGYLSEVRKNQLQVFAGRIQISFSGAQKQIENEIQKTVLFSEAPLGILLYDLKTFAIVDANKAFLSMIGASEIGEISTTSFKDLMTCCGNDQQKPGKSGTESEKTVRREMCRKDGSRFQAELTFSQVDLRGKQMALVHIRDISQQVITEETTLLSAELDRMIVRGSSLEELIRFTLRKIQKIFPFFASYFFLTAPDRRIQYLAIESADPRYEEELLKRTRDYRWDTFPGNRTLLGQAVNQNRPLYASLDNNFMETPLSEWSRQFGLSALYLIPANFEQSVIPWGVLSTAVLSERDLGKETRDHLDLIMEKLENAYKNQKEFEKLQSERNSIFEEAPDGIYLLDAQSLSILETNQVFCRMLGAKSKNDIVGKTISDITDNTGDGISEIFEKAEATQNHSSALRHRFSRLNGSHINVLLSFKQVTFRNRKAFLTHVRDITEEVQSEEANRIAREVDRLILSGSSIDDLLEAVAREIFEAFSFAGVTFAVPGVDGSISFQKHINSLDLPEDFISLIKNGVNRNSSLYQTTSFSRAISSKEPEFVCGDALDRNPLSKQLRQAGVEAIFAIPVLYGADTLPRTILVLWARHPEDMNTHLRKTLVEFTDKIRLAFFRMEEQNRIRLGQSAMESSQSPMVITRPDGSVEWANPTFYRMIGAADLRPEDIHLPVLFPCPPEKVKKKHLEEVLCTGEVFDGIETGWTIDKRRISVRAIVSPLRNHAGAWTHSLIHFNDITQELELSEIDHLIAELDLKVLKGDSLRDLLAHLSRRVRKIHESIWVHVMIGDQAGNLWTQAFSAEKASIADEIRKIPEPVHSPGDTDSISNKAIRSGRHESLHITEMGDDYPFAKLLKSFGVAEVHAFPFRATEGRPGIITIMQKTVGSIASVSQDRIEQLLKRLSNVIERYSEQERLRLQEAAMENVANGIMITDTTGKIESVNEALVHMSGYEREELIGGNPRILKSGRHDPSLYESLWQNLLSGKSADNILINRRKDGSFFTVESSITPMRSPSGKITHFIQIQKDVSQRIQKDREIWNLANIDPLTGLFNRAAFLTRLKSEIRRSARDAYSLILLFLDLDGFKEINDTMGHAAGDRYLKVIAERLLNSVRTNDLVARLGGDEFVILLTEVSDIMTTTSFVTKILERLSMPVMIDEREIHTSSSIGLSTYPKDAVDGEDLLRKADIAMYQVKSHEKNGWLFYDPEMEEKIRKRYNQESALRTAIANREFTLFYQPQVDIPKNKIVGVEALVRWKKPSGEIISPIEFIPLAEETGLIIPLGEWILEEVIRTAARWHTGGRPRIRLAMNVSIRQFWNQQFWDLFDRKIEEHPDLSKWLTIELTESLLMKDPIRARERLMDIRNQGVKIAIDDFGTGYSSLSYLTRLPVDVLKVPQEFVLQMKNSSLDLSMVRTIIQMAKSLSLQLVGEGAETRSEVDILTELECMVLQGYAISRPLPLDQMESFMDREIEPFL